MARPQKPSTVVELGPRSLALLRRIVFLLEQLSDIDSTDPGGASEIDTDTADDASGENRN